jgi:6-phosphogluconolactonase
MPKVLVKTDLNELSQYAAEFFETVANDAIRNKGRFAVSLSGGSTPKALYRLLSSDEFRHRVDWSKVYFFFGDERFVPPDSEESNFRMVNEALFEPLNINGNRIFRWITESTDATAAASEYEQDLIRFFGLKLGQLPRFDLMLLGLGEDGHTASLFPNSPALSVSDRLATANWVEKLNANRLTLTFPVIDNSSVAAFMVSGEGKANVLADILEGRERKGYPAAFVDPNDGELIWLVDESAASKLKTR